MARPIVKLQFYPQINEEKKIVPHLVTLRHGRPSTDEG
jgi:hypothetical protein